MAAPGCPGRAPRRRPPLCVGPLTDPPCLDASSLPGCRPRRHSGPSFADTFPPCRCPSQRAWLGASAAQPNEPAPARRPGFSMQVAAKVKPRINGALMAQYVNKHVTLYGKVPRPSRATPPHRCPVPCPSLFLRWRAAAPTGVPP
eukprot:gene3589-biopygen3578